MKQLNHMWYGLTLAFFLTLSVTGNTFTQENRLPGTRQYSEVQKGDYQIGLLAPLRYRISTTMEMQTHPILDFVIPNARLVWIHNTTRDRRIQTTHGFTYPTPLLRMISRKGTGGILPDDPTIPTIPAMVSLYNEIRVIQSSIPTLEYYFSAGLGLAGTFGTLDSRTTIDLPVVFPRMGVFYNGYNLNLGTGISWALSGKWVLKSDTKILLLPGYTEQFFWEHQGQVFWEFDKSWYMMFGYLLTYGNYPFGSQYHLLPLFDVGYQW